MYCDVSAKLVGLTQPVIPLKDSSAEGLIAYCARVSNPTQQDKDIGTLFDYCIRNKHWSIFEMVDAVLEVKAPRDITRQLLRHDFKFQEFSQRYSSEISTTYRDYRSQDTKNRQNSIDDLPHELVVKLENNEDEVKRKALEAYRFALDNGVAKECARVLLPEGLTMSTLYVKGPIRNWLHYIDVRSESGVTQEEHVVLAKACRAAIAPHFPNIFKGL